MVAVRYLAFVWGIFGPPTDSTQSVVSLQNLVMIDAVVFDNRNAQIFGAFGWKNPIHVPKIGVLGLSDPLNGL